MKKYLLVVLCLFIMVGCQTVPSSLTVKQSTFSLSLSGEQKDYVSVDADARAGLNTRSVLVYDKNGNLEYFDTERGDGMFTRFWDNGAQGAFQAAGFATGMAVVRPARTSVGGNNVQGNAAAEGGAGGAGGAGGTGGSGTAVAGSVSGVNLINKNTVTGGSGWIPPGQAKK